MPPSVSFRPATIAARSLRARTTANLRDEAVKYTPRGGRGNATFEAERAEIRLPGPTTGPAIPAVDARVHRVELRLGDADPGLRVVLVSPTAAPLAGTTAG